MPTMVRHQKLDVQTVPAMAISIGAHWDRVIPSLACASSALTTLTGPSANSVNLDTLEMPEHKTASRVIAKKVAQAALFVTEIMVSARVSKE